MSYSALLERFKSRVSPHLEQIEMDLRRTFPDNESANTDEVLGKMRRLLSTFANMFGTIGYCQGMNFIAGMLVLVTNEEDAFWLLVWIVKHTFPCYYTNPESSSADNNAIWQVILMR